MSRYARTLHRAGWSTRPHVRGARGDRRRGAAAVSESGYVEAAAPNIPLVVWEIDQQSHPGPTDPSALARIDMPVLLLWGSETSDWFRDGVRHVAEHVADSRIREIPGVGHFGAEIETEPIARELIRFFEAA